MWSNSFGFDSSFSVGRELLFNNDGELKKLREILPIHMLYTPKLPKLLERIRGDREEFYNDELAKDIVQDIKDGGGIFKLRSPTNGTLGDCSWCSTPPPGNGLVLIFISNICPRYIIF